MQLAEVNKNILDMIGKGLQQLISGLGAALMTASSWLSKVVTARGGLGSIITTVIPAMLGIKLAKGASGLTSLFSKGGGEAAGEAAEGAGALAGFGSKLLKFLPAGIGGLIDGGTTFAMDKAQGKSTGAAAGEGIGAGIGHFAGLLLHGITRLLFRFID